jgi:type I restriction-modification system DNA methylase subunit
MDAFTNVFKNCLNILRDNEALVGDKALATMNYMITLKLLEPQFDGEIKIDEYDYDFSHVECDREVYKKNLFEVVRFSNLSKKKEVDLPKMFERMWEDILSVHPATRSIFLPGKSFGIKHTSTYKKLIDKLTAIDLTNTPFDVLGNAYEEVIKDILVGKVLGQFFTQPIVKKMMVKLIDPQIHPDGTIDSCCDPTMGTGGFLITYLNTILKQATEKNIEPDWDFIKTHGLYGKEIEPDTYQLAVSNMLISSGHMFNALDCGDSIRGPITRKFDNILANPPFGIKGLKYDDFRSSIKNEYTPIKTDNAVSLFIQAIIYMLKIGGKCAVVLPDGQDLFSKTNATLVAIREYLLKTCDLKEVIYLPSGIFTHTSIKTCIFFFIKKVEGTEVLKTTVKMTKKTNKISRYDYEFSKELQTTEVAFYNYVNNGDKEMLVTVPIDDIVKNSYSLNYAEYMKSESVKYDDSVVVKTIGEVFRFETGKNKASECDNSGSYVFITNADNKTHSSYSIEGENLFICKINASKVIFKTKIKYYNGKCSYSSLMSRLIPIIPNVNLKYMYYYFNTIITKIEAFNKGVANKTLDIELLSSTLQIPIPSIERQKKIVEYLDFIYETSNKASTAKIANLKKANEYAMSNQINYGKNEVKTLGEVCEFQNGTQLDKKNIIDGDIPIFGGGVKIVGTHNKSNRNGNETIVCGTGAYSGYVNHNNGNPFWASQCFTMKSNDITKMHDKYLYYYSKLVIENQIMSNQKGTAIPFVRYTQIIGLDIHIPSLERQKEIVEYCEENDKLISKLEKEIERNLKDASAMMATLFV